MESGLNGRFSASILFIDISGFTSLTETLFQYDHQGAEILSALLAEVFGEMVALVYARQGFIPMFAGDGFFAIFPGDPAQSAESAWQTAVAIQRSFRSARGPVSLFVTPYGNFSIGVKIGMAAGEVEWGILYNDQQATSYFRGEALYTAADAEQTAVTGELISHDSLLPYLPSQFERWPVDVPTFHKIRPVHATLPPPHPRPSLALPPVLAAFLRNQGQPPTVAPNFRQICPVFVSFQAEDTDWPGLVQQIMTLAEQYGGTFTRLEFGDKGDMMLIWFGAPRSYENNVERAAKFLLTLQQETAVPWRASMAYGLVWSGNRGGEAYSEYSCVGDALNTAARMVSQVQWGQIWVDESAAHDLPMSYTLRSLGAFQFKGKQKVLHLFRLTGVRDTLPLSPVRDFVGREQELSRCHEALVPLLNGRFAGVITIQGEAGIGKSRLAVALRQQVAEQVTWLTCPADDILRESLNPFQWMLSAWCRQSPEQETAENVRQFHTHLDALLDRLHAVADDRVTAVSAELKRTQISLAELADVSLETTPDFVTPELRFTNSLLALTAFLQAESLHKPLVLHVEDAHWLDEETWRFLVDLPRRLAGFPLILLMSGRSDGAFVTPFKWETAVSHTAITLQPFTSAETEALCCLLLGKPVTDELVDFLQTHSQGNPFFVEQLVLELRQQEFFTMVQRGETAVFTLTTHDQHVLPQTLTALLTARLDRLSAPVRKIVQIGSVLGQRFTLPLLTAICADAASLPNKVQEAIAQQIWQAPSESVLQFQHALLRDVAYTMQPQTQRRETHYQAAVALEKLYADDLTVYYREIAHHYHRAFENGMLSARHATQRYLRLAGEQAAKMYENETAVSYFSLALSLSIQEASKFPLLLAREAVYHLQGQRELQAQDLASLSRIAHAQNDEGLIATAALRWARQQEALGDYDQSIACAQSAHANASSPVQAAEACWQWGQTLVAKGAYQDAVQKLFAALRLAEETGERPLQSKALYHLGKISLRRGNYQTAIRHYYRALSLCQETGDRQLEGAVLNKLGIIAMFMEDWGTAVAHYDAALTIAQEIGARRVESRVLNNLGSITAMRFQFVKARDYFCRDHQICQEIDDIDGEGQALGNLGYIELCLGNYAQAENFMQQNLQITRQTGNRHSEAEALVLLGLCKNGQTEWAEAESLFKLGQQIAHEIGDQETKLYALAGLGNALIGLGRAEEGAALLRQAVVGYRVLQMEAFAMEALAGWVRAQLSLNRAALTRPAVEKLLDHLHTVDPFRGADAPLFILWTCYQALLATGDARAGSVLEVAVELVKTAVAHIPDQATRHAFLENIPWHREIMLAHNASFNEN